MKYYQVSRTSEPKIIGIKTGASQVELLDDKIDKNQNYKDFENHFSGYNKGFWHNQHKVFELNPPVIKGKLRKNAKQTDIMEYGPVFSFLYCIYSERFISILKSFNLGSYKLFDFEICDVVDKYYLLFIQSIILEEIIYNKSTVITGYKQLNDIKYHSINNAQDFIEFKQKEPTSNFETLTIPKKYYGRDIIDIQATALPFYSEKLIDFLLNCGIVGLQIGYNNSIKLNFY